MPDMFCCVIDFHKSFDVGASSNNEGSDIAEIKCFEHFSLWQLNPRCQESAFSL